MCERDMVVSDIVEEVDLVLLQQKTSSNGVDWSVAPSFIEESTIFVQGFEKVSISLRPEPVKIANFEVRPLGHC